MVDKVEAPDPSTVVFHLKFATSAFLPALADPFNCIYKKAILDKDPHWYEKNVMGSGPFKFVGYETGQSIKGERNPDYYHKGLPYLDGFTGIYADKQAVRVDAIRSDRAAIEFRGMPPAARDELVNALGDKITVQEGDWNVGSGVTPNHKKKPFDDPRVRRALTLAIDRWGGAPGLSKIAIVQTVGGIVFPGSPLAANQGGAGTDRRVLARYREIARRGAAAAEGGGRRGALLRAAQPQCRPALQIRRDLADRRVEQDRAARDAAGRADRARGSKRCATAISMSCSRPRATAWSIRCSMSRNACRPRSTPKTTAITRTRRRSSSTTRCCAKPIRRKQRALMRQFENYVLDDQAHKIWLLWWHRIVPYRSYVKGWKIAPTPFHQSGPGDDLARQINERTTEPRRNRLEL